MIFKWLTGTSPSRIIIASTMITVFIGTTLLLLPISHTIPLSFINALFVAISAITASGLTPVNLESLTPFGIVTVTVLMQIGSLGIIILTLFIAHVFFTPRRPAKKIAAELLGIKRKRDTRRMLIFVIALTLAVELLGAIFLFTSIRFELPLLEAIFSSIFHSISAFTNTGFALSKESMIYYSRSPIVLITLSTLMVLGGIGFTTLKEAILYISSFTQKIRYKFSLSSRIIWRTTFVLIACSFLLCLTLEHNHAFAGMNGVNSALNALFYVVSSMGTGLHTVAVSATRVPTLLLIMVIAYIGGSPGSAGSGIKTTTVAIIFSALRSVIKGKKHVILRGQRIDIGQVTKSIAMISLSIPFIIIIAFLLLTTDATFTLLDCLFETVSGFANMGISTGITPRLNIIGKLLICITMLVGRVGMFTLIFSIKPLKETKEKALQKRNKLS